MELKFRAWHKENKEYWDVMSILFDDQELELYEWGRVGFDEVILEQYTGMKDKNGIEIYVGDIVKYTHDWEVYAVENEIAVVEFEEGGFSPMQLANGGTYYALEAVPTYEVIGNIHDREERLNV